MEPDYVAAWRRFKESEQFKRWTDRSTIGPPGESQYLENRILAAFEMGWNVAVAEMSKAAEGKSVAQEESK
jgi:hypothetical protein